LNIKALEDALDECVGVVHLAGTSRVIQGERNPLQCLKNNLDGTDNVIRAAMRSPRKPWIIYASSREVYGQQSFLPVKEDVTLAPLNVYAYSKVLAEAKILEAREQSLKTNILRFSNVFGQCFDYVDRVIPAFCRAALSGTPLHVEGSANLFDFTYVTEVVRGISSLVDIMIEEPENLPPIHLTTGRGITLGEAAQIIVEKAKSCSSILEKPSRSFDVARFCGDPKRAHYLLDWQHMLSFERAVEIFLNDLNVYVWQENMLNHKVVS
jgi:UDP-glucose 4-epimerase